MENKITSSELLEIYPEAKSFLERVSEIAQNEDFLQQEELKFFSELLRIFSSDEYLPVEQLKSFPAKVILTYLSNSHRYYLNKQLPEIEQILEQLSLQNLDIPSYISPFFSWMRQNMEKHFRIEEQSLFPYIESLELVQQHKKSRESLRDEFKDFSAKRFIATHDDEIENQLSEVKKQIVRSFSSVDELFPYRILIHKLDLLEKDLRLHARVEDEVLVPKTLQWESH